MTTILLKFPKSETRLAGFPYGETIYKEQAKNIITFDDEIMIIFPEQIEKVASSFIQGFFADIIKTIGYKGFERNVIIKSKSDELTASIRKNIY